MAEPLTTKELAVQNQTEITTQPQSLSVSQAYVQETTQSIALLQDMVKKLLRRGRDFGRTPGTRQDGLWDPGASLIIGSFNCYVGQRRILNLVNEGDKITVVVEVPLISRQTRQEVGSGIGAASTLETKYGKRWYTLDELQELGYTKEEVEALHADKQISTSKREPGKYRIDNPYAGELLNTLVKQASKRAEVDAASALPGVASVLRELFDPESQKFASESKKGKEIQDYDSPRWQRFWGETKRLGYTETEVHRLLGVKSMKDWLGRGFSLDEAITTLIGKGQQQPEQTNEEILEQTELEKDLFGEPLPKTHLGYVDKQWFDESLSILRSKSPNAWSEETLLSYMKNMYKTKEGTVEDAVAKLDKNAAAHFTNSIQAELEKGK